MTDLQKRIQHPASLPARLIRALRGLRKLRGWERIASAVAPQDDADKPFLVANRSGFFAGDLSSFIDRRMYLFGEYEEDLITEFLARIPAGRHRTILDVGANVGTHSVAFARHFGRVHAFEPNPSLWLNFETNVQLNDLKNVSLHKVALADHEGELPFYTIEKRNFGLGTLSTASQYDMPLKQVATVKVVTGDDYVRSRQIGAADAIKIDVQGFELEVLKGLQKTIATDQPIIWIETGESTVAALGTVKALQALIPFESNVLQFRHERRGPYNCVRLHPITDGPLASCDYLIMPAHR